MSSAEALAALKGEDKTDDGLPIVTVDGAKATICFNRPDVRNRIGPADIEVILDALDRFEADPAIRAVIFTGKGKVFSSGFNLNVFYDNFVDNDPEREVRADDNFFGDFTNRIETCRLPTILAANGPVYGGATDVALSCDFRFAVSGVEAFLPASRLGIHYYGRGMQRYVARLGLAAAKRICLTSETLNEEELLKCGFFDAVMDEEAMWARVNDLAETLARQAPMAVEGMKRSLNEISYGELDEKKTNAEFLKCINSNDFKEGVTAWFEKRRPEFKGN
ncbi:MAG: enoyl-CoA hydratase/isomerase family protein [Pseudomonadota bacterium]